ncbi:DUF2268 domain-containing putative Zn-dependent protease [Niastella sp. OAS944]|uniref:DUF2268 domain-containing putative Zn-dependent protease n=1 Tax=Niastella sp. OAS944 TaxID=2664089 RepID=UPI003491F7F3|nr:hypothetical protein [Chitinophagaceae bacterium OAS944]
MLRISLFIPALLFGFTIAGKAQQPLQLNQPYNNLAVTKTDTLRYGLRLQKGGIFQFSIEQQGIALAYELADATHQVKMKSRQPVDINGFLKSEYAPTVKTDYTLKVYRFNHPQNTDSGKLSIFIKSLNKVELAERQKIRKELEPENAKTVLTADIDHFWQAVDALSSCKSHADSLSAIQKLYFDRATDGLIDFIAARDLTAEAQLKLIARYPKFYASSRKNTLGVKNSEKVIEELFTKFQSLYANFKPFKVCFAIGILNTGGTVSDKFVLIGTEISASSKDVDVSEFITYKETNRANMLSGDGDLVQKIRNMVAHECVHTQQKNISDTAAACPLLWQVLKEGICDFIGEMVAGKQINSVAHEYGDKHEKELWSELRSNLCSSDMSKWLYNGQSAKDKPGDLGYYMGYRIAKAYYEQATNKRQAIVDMIELTLPMQFLQQSKYSPGE